MLVLALKPVSCLCCLRKEEFSTLKTCLPFLGSDAAAAAAGGGGGSRDSFLPVFPVKRSLDVMKETGGFGRAPE